MAPVCWVRVRARLHGDSGEEVELELPVEAEKAISTKTLISGTKATGPIRPTATSPRAEINVVASTIVREPR